MSLLATVQDFEPADDVEGASALYYEPHNADGLTGYRQFDHFTDRINSLVNLIPPTNQKFAIWGCAWGYLVDRAVAAGYDAYGFDASSYAISKGKSIFPALAPRLFVRNALVSKDVSGSKTDAGMRGNAKFAILLTEDMFTCMSDAEVTSSLGLLRPTSTGNEYHLMTILEQTGTNNDSRINWKTSADWKTKVAPDIVLGIHGQVW